MKAISCWMVAAVMVCGSAAWAAVLPTVTGCHVEIYVEVGDPMSISFAPDGTLFVGRDLAGSGGGPADPTKIHRVSPGGGVVEEYGNAAIPDPDAVLYDLDGVVSGVPGSVLVGGCHDTCSIGRISAILPDQSVVTLFDSSSSFLNIMELAFDSFGRLVFSDWSEPRVWVSDGGEPALLCSLPARPGPLTISDDGHIYTSDENGVVRVHDSDGNFVREVVTFDRCGFRKFLPRFSGNSCHIDIAADAVFVPPSAGVFSGMDGQ